MFFIGLSFSIGTVPSGKRFNYFFYARFSRIGMARANKAAILVTHNFRYVTAI
jgi:hypothetical protein